jgi:gliding motility-associated-like protein
VVDNFTDADGDGWFDEAVGVTIPDFDNDGAYDFRDVDSDGDGILDKDEYGTDCDNDGVDDVNDIDPCYDGLDIPEAFSPNGDGINDHFEIKEVGRFPENNLKIFNRWGNLVFEMDSYDNSWDGTSMSKLNFIGSQLPTGVYYYGFDTKTDKHKVVNGYIYLQR